jgi:hypothetical protein
MRHLKRLVMIEPAGQDVIAMLPGSAKFMGDLIEVGGVVATFSHEKNFLNPATKDLNIPKKDKLKHHYKEVPTYDDETVAQILRLLCSPVNPLPPVSGAKNISDDGWFFPE